MTITAFQKLGSSLAALALLSSCGGGGGSSNSGGVTLPIQGGGGATPAPSPTPSACSLRSRQDWVSTQMNEWYLFPETLPNNLNPAPFTSVQAYLDALTEAARNQGRDRFFTFITSIAEENAFFASGATAGFGIRLNYDTAASRVFILDVFEGAPAVGAGFDRGSELLAIGTTSSNLQTVTQLFAQGGAQAVSNALGASTAGTSRVLRFRNAAGNEVTTTVTKADFDIQPISPNFGVQIINDSGRQVGYVNMRTFIGSADAQLRAAFNQFRTAGVTEIIIDLRYNGGGLVSTAELFADLLGRDRFTSELQGITRFRTSKSNQNITRNFQTEANSIAPTNIAFITTGSSASASELVINAMIPYLGNNMALVGSDTFGKPVGQIGLDQAACDDRLRVVAFSTENADGNANYFTGLASSVTNTCQAADDFTNPMGSIAEASTARALGYLNGQACTAISTAPGAAGQKEPLQLPRPMLVPEKPTVAQREVPGAF